MQHLYLIVNRCVFAELLTNKTLFPGKTELEQVSLMCELLGDPNDRVWPGFSKLPNVPTFKRSNSNPYNELKSKFRHVLGSEGFDLLERLLCYDPKRRITAEEAMNHKFFREHPLPQERKLMPTFLPTHSLGEISNAVNTVVQNKRPREDKDDAAPAAKKPKLL